MKRWGFMIEIVKQIEKALDIPFELIEKEYEKNKEERKREKKQSDVHEGVRQAEGGFLRNYSEILPAGQIDERQKRKA
jgi:cytoskeletal protein RodZ